jgi:hypothetical protein
MPAVEAAVDNTWILVCGALVFMYADSHLCDLRSTIIIEWLLVIRMQFGFALVEGGCVQARNTNAILLKNLMDRCLVFLTWWSLGTTHGFSVRCGRVLTRCVVPKTGWGIAFGDAGGTFTGTNQFFGHGLTQFAIMFYQAQFACTATTIIGYEGAGRQGRAHGKRLNFIVTCCVCDGRLQRSRGRTGEQNRVLLLQFSVFDFGIPVCGALAVEPNGLVVDTASGG